MFCKLVLQRRLYRQGRPRINRPLGGFVNLVTEVVVVILLIVIGTLAEHESTAQLACTFWFFKRKTSRPQVVVSATIDRATISLDSARLCSWNLSPKFSITTSGSGRAHQSTAHLSRWIWLVTNARSRRYCLGSGTLTITPPEPRTWQF